LLFVNLMSCTLYVCLIVSLRRLHQFWHSNSPLAVEVSRDIWIVRLLVQNGLAMFAMWGTVASMFNFAVVLTYRTGARQDISSTVALSIFTVEILAWWILDNFIFERYMRYLVTPYVVLLLSISGILSKNWDPQTANAVYTMVLFLLVIILTAAKLTLLVWRHKYRPLVLDQEEPSIADNWVEAEDCVVAGSSAAEGRLDHGTGPS
jgi:hypothetical protein